jgi:hypothetical protein
MTRHRIHSPNEISTRRSTRKRALGTGYAGGGVIAAFVVIDLIDKARQSVRLRHTGGAAALVLRDAPLGAPQQEGRLGQFAFFTFGNQGPHLRGPEEAPEGQADEPSSTLRL